MEFHVMVINKKSWIAGLLLVMVVHGLGFADDWPMWRYDVQRSAASPQPLPERLDLQWVRDYPQLEPTWDDPLNRDLMQNDKIYEPIVLGKTMFVGSNVFDCITALDTETGEEKWTFYADGPVRFAPVAYWGKVYFVCDDGYLYCLDAERGTPIWKYRSVSVDRIVLGNERLISSWPARGAPVVKDGIVYFGSGIWPFMGVFLHAVDAETGEEIWVNDGFSSTYRKQPHNSPSFANVAPQGILAIAGDKFLVPGGRSVPACFDRKTGKLDYYRFDEQNKSGGAFVCTNGKHFINYHRDQVTSLFDVATGDRLLSAFCKMPVFKGNSLFGRGETVKAFDYANMRQVEYKRKEKGKVVIKKRWEIDTLWEFEADARGDLIQAGNRLYAGGENIITAIDLPEPGGEPKTAWTVAIDGTAERLIAADDKLFVVTQEGRIYAFGGAPAQVAVHPYTVQLQTLPESTAAEAKRILDTTDVREGYCLIYGKETGDLAEALLRQSNLRIHAVDPDRQSVDRLRKRFVEAGLYGKRLSVHVGDSFTFKAPPYFADLIVIGDDNLSDAIQPVTIKTLFQRLRPYGGIACLKMKSDRIEAAVRIVEECDLANAKTQSADGYLLLSREGALPGAGEWTHQYGNVANTIKSDDRRVKLPLGILWFGGNSHEDILPRHGHGPPEQVLGGRLFIQGMDCLSARDVYTGRVLWKRTLPELGTFGVYFDETYRETPLNPSYNQVHIPGANGRGTNFVVTHDRVYIIVNRSRCLVLDPVTGETVHEIELPLFPGSDEPPEWSYIGVYQDYLIAGGGYVNFRDSISTESIEKKKKRFYDFDITTSRRLIVMDRYTGEIKWTFKSGLGILNNAVAVGNDKIFCIDRMPAFVSDALKRRGKQFRGTPRVLAFDIHSGDIVWSSAHDVFGTWLGYSETRDILLMSGRYSRDMFAGELKKGLATYQGRSGTPLWRNDATYNSPSILHGDTIIADPNAYNLLTGEQIARKNSLTGGESPWAYQRNYGCNYAIASEHLMTFRSAAAGFFDLEGDSGTGNLGGFKTGCTSNLVVADGVFNAPDYTRTCQCSYQNQTSLALIHDPEMELWTFNAIDLDGDTIQRMGINLGAPGDRRAENGTLWLEYPVTGGPSPEIHLRTEPENPQWFQHHSLRAAGDEAKWICASGGKGLERLTFTLSAKPQNDLSYTLRLFFLEPDTKQPGERQFDVFIQGKPVLKNFDIVREAGGVSRAVMKEFENVSVSRTLTIELKPSKSCPDAEPVLSGIEIVQIPIETQNVETK